MATKNCPINPSNFANCRPWDMSNSGDSNYMDMQNQEQLTIAGAQVNVHKLLGVHEQTELIDLAKNGSPLTGGDAPNYPAKYAFQTTRTEWRSKQTGLAAITSSAYIGYDFGIIKITTGRQRYGIDADIRHMITTIRIKQSSNPKMRVTKARVERSQDGVHWFGVAIVNLPNNDQLNTVHFKHSVTNRYWRLRPLDFTGDECDSWGVQALEMHDCAATELTNIQDKIFLENRDRDYDPDTILLKGFYQLLSPQTELTRFGIEIPSATYNIKLNFNNTVANLGRPIVIGDIIELPSETQYTPDLRPIKRYLEVTDVTWDADTYTPGWQPLMLLVTAQPALASQETQDIFGKLAKSIDSSGLFDQDEGNHQMWQDFTGVNEEISQQALNSLPERGSEGSNTVREFTNEEIATAKTTKVQPNIAKFGLNPKGLYVEDAIPSNNAPYTEGPEYPPEPKDGDYHRLTYVGLSQNVPARLYRWSQVKDRWVYMETDRRQQYNNQKALLDEYLVSPTKTPENKIK
jgi:hypothetical protein